MKKALILLAIACFIPKSLTYGDTTYCKTKALQQELEAKKNNPQEVTRLKANGCGMLRYNDECTEGCKPEIDHDGFPENVCECFPVNLN